MLKYMYQKLKIKVRKLATDKCVATTCLSITVIDENLKWLLTLD